MRRSTRTVVPANQPAMVPHPLSFTGPILTGEEIIYCNPRTGEPAPPNHIVRPGTPLYEKVQEWALEGISRQEWKARLLPWFDRERWCWRDVPEAASERPSLLPNGRHTCGGTETS